MPCCGNTADALAYFEERDNFGGNSEDRLLGGNSDSCKKLDDFWTDLQCEGHVALPLVVSGNGVNKGNLPKRSISFVDKPVVEVFCHRGLFVPTANASLQFPSL